MSVIVQQNTAAIDQALELIGELRASAGEESVARVCPHFRHCIDFYDCFLSGAGDGRIDYDARSRSGELESRLDSIEEALGRIRGRLARIDVATLESGVEVRADAVHEDTPWSRSTVGRELVFLLSHTIHHHALIDLLLRADGVEVPPDFGMAPSTLKHEAECAR